MKSLFIFRRDLRIDDNSGLISALEKSKNVIPIFILDKNLLNNENRSLNAIQFMRESLIELNSQLYNNKGKLYIFYGNPEQIVGEIISNTELNVSEVIFNRDYTPYSQMRDKKIYNCCIKNKIKVRQFADLLLNEPESIHKKNGHFYTVFTPFYKTSSQMKVQKPEPNNHTNYYVSSIETEIDLENLNNIVAYNNPKIFIHGGRSNALKILRAIHKFENYDIDRDYPFKNSTTKLSAHLRFGTVSIREVYEKISQILGENHPLIRQLYWREFYIHLGYHFPHVFKRSFKRKYDRLDWNYNKDLFKKWYEGKTGFPIIDAGMRQLNETGFMHNRVRMIVASFLTKDLHIDWRLGEKYFAKQLLDYDISVNNGNWQWSASTGADAVPYFRIFNPWTQQKKFDPNCEYIKQYLPELITYNPKLIHDLVDISPEYKFEYPLPMVNHKKEREVTKLLFKDMSV